MPRLLILLTLPPDVTEQYRARLTQKFPEISIDVIATADKAATALPEADMLLTFGQMMKNLKLDLANAAKLKWVQALGTGLDGITDQPALKKDVTVTSLQGVRDERGRRHLIAEESRGLRPHPSGRRASEGPPRIRPFRPAHALLHRDAPDDQRQGVRGNEAQRLFR